GLEEGPVVALQGLESVQKPDVRCGIVTNACRKDIPELVRLDFLLLVESLIQQLLDGCINEALERFRILMGVRKSCLGDARQALAPLDHLQNVLLADVRDLVSHHGSQFSFVPNLYQEPTRDEDVPSRRGEGIDAVVGEQGGADGKVRQVV